MITLLTPSLVPDISVSGKQEGIIKGETRSGLLYECEKIIENKKPKYLLMENVKNLVGKKFKQDFDEWCEYLESLGYKNYWKVINAKDFGVAQNRERVFMWSVLGEHKPYEFPQRFKLGKRLKDFLENEVEEKYYLSKEIQDRFKQTKIDDGVSNIIGTTAPEFRSVGQRDRVYGQLSVCPCFTSTDYKQPKQIIDYLEKPQIIDDTQGFDGIRYYNEYCPTLRSSRSGLKTDYNFRIRKLTPKECLRLMGLSDEDIDKIQSTGLSDSSLYKLAGNSIVKQCLDYLHINMFVNE